MEGLQSKAFQSHFIPESCQRVGLGSDRSANKDPSGLLLWALTPSHTGVTLPFVGGNLFNRRLPVRVNEVELLRYVLPGFVHENGNRQDWEEVNVLRTFWCLNSTLTMTPKLETGKELTVGACEPGTAPCAALRLPLLRKDPPSVWPAPPELSSVLACRAVPPQQEREGPSLPEARLEAASPLEERARGANFPEGSDTALKGCLRHMGDSGRAGAWG